MKTLKSALFMFGLVQFIFCTQPKNAPTMDAVNRDNARINYTMTGIGDTTLLFVHGSYMDQSCWKSQVDYFSKHYTVVTLDLPGHGQSGKDRTDWTMKGFGEDVNAVIKALDLKNVILIGHSMGGDINLIAATDHPEPVIGFIGIETLNNAATPLPPEFQEQIAAIEHSLETDFINTNEKYARMDLFTPATPPQVIDRVVQAYRNAYAPMGVPITREIFRMDKVEKELLPKLKVKLYLINVDYSMPTNEEALKANTTKGYEVIHMPGTSHYPMLENPDVLNKLLEETIHKI